MTHTYLSSNLTLASLRALRFRAGSLKTSLLTTVLSRGMSTEYLRKEDTLIRQMYIIKVDFDYSAFTITVVKILGVRRIVDVPVAQW